MSLVHVYVAAMSVVAAPVELRLPEVRAAARQNTQALQAELEHRRAIEQKGIAWSAILPHAGLDASANISHASQRRFLFSVPDANGVFRQTAVDVDPSTSASLNLSLTVSQLLYDGGRWWNQIAQSGAQVEATLGQAREQAMASELEATRRFYELYRAQRTLEVLEATRARSETQLARARAMFEVGRAQKRDAIDAEVNLGNDRMVLLRQRQRIVNAQVELAVWLARPGREELVAVVPGGLAGVPKAAPGLEQALESAARDRPLIAALSRQVRAAELAVSVAQAGYLPKLSVFGQYGRSSPEATTFFADPARQNTFTGGLSISWDLFSGFGNMSQVAQARLSQRTSEQHLVQARAELEGDVRRALVAVQTQQEIAHIAGVNRALAKSGLELAEQRYQAGAGATLDVRDAQLKLTQAELADVESHIDLEIARAALARATGTLGAEEAPP